MTVIIQPVFTAAADVIAHVKVSTFLFSENTSQTKVAVQFVCGFPSWHQHCTQSHKNSCSSSSVLMLLMYMYLMSDDWLT